MKSVYINIFIWTTFLFYSMSVSAEVVIGSLKYRLISDHADVIGYEGVPTDVVIPETINYGGSSYKVIGILPDAFENCSTIKSLTALHIQIIFQGEPKTGGWKHGAFLNCINLEKVYFSEITHIYDGAFAGCEKLKFIDLGSKLKELRKGCFSKTNLDYLVFPAEFNQYSWSGSLFEGCEKIPYLLFMNKNNCFFTGDYIDGMQNHCFDINDLFQWLGNTYTYSGKAPTPQYTYSLPFGFTSNNEIEGLECNSGTYTKGVTFTFANDDMSFNVDIPYTYTINPVTLTAKVKDASRLYGDADPDFSSKYTGFVNNEDASVLTSNGSYTTTATQKSDVGTYAIKQTGATAQNYVFEYEDGTLTVNKAPLTMSANDKTMTYGGKVPTLDAKYEGLKNSETQPVWNTEPKYSTTATSESKVGAYPITISDADAKNYQLTINGGTMTVEKAELTVNADNKNRIYGDANPEFTLTYTGLKNGEIVPEWEKLPIVETTADAKSNVGTYPISIRDAVAVNYNIAAKDGTLTVNKATLQITPNDATRRYGEENPKFELSYVGLKNNENLPEWTTDPVFSTNATKTSSVGEYTIQVKTAEARNYTLEKKVGTLTITKAPLTVGVNNCSRKYGETNPTFELHYDGLLNNETAPQWTTMPSITTEATLLSDVGEYKITGTGGVMKNYETEGIASGVLTITQASLTLKAKDVSRLYFEDNPEFSFSCVGLVGNDDASVITTKPRIATSATKTSSVGVYAIDIMDAASKNYTIGYEKGQLTINKRQLTVSTKDYTRTYGEENPKFELIYTGFVNNEDESVLIAKPKATTKATANTDVGIYDITIGNGVAENYDFSYSSGKLTIEKAYQTLTWDQDFSDVKLYDQVELLATASSGLGVTYSIEGEQICSILKIGKKQYLDCKSGGEVVVVAIQEGNKNYWQTTKIYKTIVVKSPSALNGHEYVDLGLPSGKCWAGTNYGSSTPEGYGTYLNWDENSIISSKWGADWTTPSIEDIKELESSCTWEWSTKNGHDGYNVKGNNGNSIFLPASGYMMQGQSSAKKVGEWVYYWSSVKSGDMGSIMMCTSSNVWYGEMNATMTKLPIRPITKSMSSDIRGVVASSDDSSQEIIGIYDLQGHKLNDLGKGMNIIKMSNGTTKKVYVK